MDECLFCRIVRGEIASDIIEEGAGAIAFRDINPQAPVHVLIVPREHIESVSELSTDRCDLLEEMFGMINEIALSEGVAQTGYRVIVNSGEDGGQDVGHVHFHLMGGRFMGWPPG